MPGFTLTRIPAGLVRSVPFSPALVLGSVLREHELVPGAVNSSIELAVVLCTHFDLLYIYRLGILQFQSGSCIGPNRCQVWRIVTCVRLAYNVYVCDVAGLEGK